MNEYKRCKRCVMDNAGDDTICFDENGFCNYCNQALSEINTTTYFPGVEGEKKLNDTLSMIKEKGMGKQYDCIMGISGGLDSAYLAYLGHKWGLRILAVHIDDGFDTEISKQNIKKLVDACGIRMEVIKPDAEQFNDLSLAYMKASVPNLAIPQDNVLFAFLYECARKNNIKYFLTGGNYALECILQQGNTHSAMDLTNLRDIHKRFGTKPINELRFISSYRKYIDSRVFGLKTIRLLDYIDYNRERAFTELKEFCGFEYYGGKHLENEFTAFLQTYWLPKKFGVDKRKSHLSSMIASGQMTREEAIQILENTPVCDEQQMKRYIDHIKKAFGISDKEFDVLMAAPGKQHKEYKYDKWDSVLRRIAH